MTQSDTGGTAQEDTSMPAEDKVKLQKKLSPSAQAILRFVQLFEEKGEIDVFQEDAEFKRLRQIVLSYRGSLYSLLERRLQEVIDLGGVEIITQRDIMSLIVQLWEDNISKLTKTEVPYLEATLKYPGDSLNPLSKWAGMSYAQARRAQKRLSDSEVLKIGGMLNLEQLGLERVLIILESPSLVLSGPYCQTMLFIDGHSPRVLIVAIVPSNKREDLLDTVRSFRNTTTNASVYNLSPGKPSFSGLYSDPKKGWNLDLLHFRLMLRKGGDPITLSDVPPPSLSEPTKFTYSETRVMDAMTESLDRTAQEIVAATKLSPSTVFRKRAQFLSNGTILPRARVNIPALNDRLLLLLSPEVGGNISPAWQNLPLTYSSHITNLEDKSERKVLLLSALPTGSGSSVLDILNDETSKIDDYSAWSVAAGIGGLTKVSNLYDRRKNSWAWDVSRHFDAIGYSAARHEASSSNTPLDLA
ncbi:MAG: hypothetical protein JW779_08030 [Candidatus Thorarchaeota archaeon]|nr:hypothetical protein [Candidatus Thorarchaeota archaeon]